MTYLVIGLLLGFLCALILDIVLEEYRGPKTKEGPARRPRTNLHTRQASKVKARKTR